MFTGIVEAVGEIVALDSTKNGARITVKTGSLAMADVALGDSIATNGVCLTVVKFTQDSFSADVSLETVKRTGFAHYKKGQRVNLEKAMLPTTRFGGHIVSGHVDAVAKITAIKPLGNSTDYHISMASSIAPYIVEKGSVTVDGVSLTVNSVDTDSFRLTIVPHTTEQTIFSSYKVGSSVNIEIDVIARYVERLLTCKSAEYSNSNITQSLLERTGFIK